MSEHTIKATSRNVEGKGASRRLRRAAQLPAIVYGGKSAPQAIQIEHEQIWLASHHEWFYSSILNLDFQRVDASQALRTKVQLHFLNQETSPAGKTSGVVITHELTEVEVSCLPKDLPEAIEVDLGELAVGAVVHLSDLKLPAGVELPALKLGKEHDVAVVIAKHAKEEEVDAAAPAAADVPATKAAKEDDK